MKRRDLIKGGLLAGLAGISGLGCGVGGASGTVVAGNGAVARNGARRPVRNIIFFAYDGFNYEDLALARYFAQRLGRGPLEIEAVMAAAATGSMSTHSLTAVVTDSAAASTAWSTGRKVVNGALSMYPDGRELTTILTLAREAGKATGLFTTTRLTHATPAGWIARVPDRAMEDEIADQYLEFGPDLLLGGGQRHFAAAERADGRDLHGEFARAGYRVVHTPAELDAAARAGSQVERVLGTFHDDHLPFEIDRRYQNAGGPSLAEMARAGLAMLNRHSNGFVVQIEAGRIDHANHHNDPGGAAWDVLAADEAMAVVRQFVDQNPDTLLLMASDHATGGQAVYGIGPSYNRSTEALDTLRRARASQEYVRNQVLSRRSTPAEVREAVHTYLGIDLSDEQADQAARVMARQLRLGHTNAHSVNPGNSLYQAISTTDGRNPDRANVAFATGAHTAGLVPVLAYGAWHGPASLGVVDNTELFGWMTRALGSDFRNPEMTEAEARRLSSLRPPAELAVM